MLNPDAPFGESKFKLDLLSIKPKNTKKTSKKIDSKTKKEGKKRQNLKNVKRNKHLKNSIVKQRKMAKKKSTSQYYKDNPDARKKRLEYQREYNKKASERKKRSELVKKNRGSRNLRKRCIERL